jgi:APA family basic amino acid/polyamine antiporter
MHVAGTKTSLTLPRLLGTGRATALVISNMIGATIFGTTGLMLGALGSAPLIIAAWSIGALFALAGALSYAELGINFPSSGGEYVYLTRAYGKAYGFVTGWVSFFAGFSAPVAAAALIFAHYVTSVFPQLGGFSLTFGPVAFSLRFGSEQVIAAILIASSTMLNCFGVKRASHVQNILTLTKVLIILSLIVGGFLLGTGSWEHFAQTVPRTSNRPLSVEFMIQLLWVMVGYSGWNAATYVAEELRRPDHTLPKALALGTLIVAVLYLGLNLVFIYATPPNDLRDVIAVGQIAAKNLFGNGIAVVFSALMAISLMATVNAMVTIGPRVCIMQWHRTVYSPKRPRDCIRSGERQ